MLHVAIAIGLILGLATGLLAAAGVDFFMTVAMASEPFGTAFLNAIRMVVIPLVMAVIFTGVARLGDPRKLGRLGLTTLLFFWGTVLPAIVIGMGVMWLGLAFAPEVTMPAAAAAREAPELPGLVDFLVSLIPSNPFAAANSGSLLPLIVFTALFAAAAGTLDEEPRARLLGFAEAVSDALIKLVWWILWTAPVGIFGLAAPVTAQLGWDLIQSLAVFIICVVLALGLYIATIYMPFLKLVGGIGPVKFFGGTFGAASIAFSTTSTAAALPVTLEETKELGVSETTADLVLPLGASMYRAGSALFQGAAIVFLAFLFDVPIPPAAIGGAILATFLVSLTVAPVPSSGVVTLAPALDAVGIPLAGLSILLGIDRVPDMFRSTTNLLGQITTAVVVDRWVGEDAVDGLERAGRSEPLRPSVPGGDSEA